MKNFIKSILFVFTCLFFFSFTTAKVEGKSLNSQILLVDACGDIGNTVYDHRVSEGDTHREARRARRIFVRGCRQQ